MELRFLEHSWFLLLLHRHQHDEDGIAPRLCFRKKRKLAVHSARLRVLLGVDCRRGEI